MYPLPTFAKKATGVQRAIKSNDEISNLENSTIIIFKVNSPRPTNLPTTILVVNIKIERVIENIKITKNLASTIVVRDIGRASKSFSVLSEYSRPNTQLVMNPKPKKPPTEIIWPINVNIVGQSASPIISAFVDAIIPILLAISGYFTKSINTPIIAGINIKKTITIQRTLDLIILIHSTLNATSKLFISPNLRHLQSLRKNKTLDPLYVPSASLDNSLSLPAVPTLHQAFHSL